MSGWRVYRWGSSCPNRRVVTCPNRRVTTSYSSNGQQWSYVYNNGAYTYQQQPYYQYQQESGSSQVQYSESSDPEEDNKNEEVEETAQENGDFSNWELEALNEHNRLRAKHGAAPLKLSREICDYAQQWANYISSRNVLQHRTNRKYGENLYMSYGTHVDGTSAVKAWYNEVQYYNYAYGAFSMSTGHFTQVVWKDSRELGVAKATNGGSTYVVANYDPPGNYTGRFQSNVLPPTR